MFVYKLIVTGAGMGYSPIAPGTVGAAGACLLAVMVKQNKDVPELLLVFLIILFFFLGVFCSGKLESEWGKDPSRIVIDEVVGMWIAMVMLPSGWLYVLAAFILFRFFDIYKPLFIRKMESFKGGWGVMMDDVLAGIYSNIIIQLLSVLLKR